MRIIRMALFALWAVACGEGDATTPASVGPDASDALGAALEQAPVRLGDARFDQAHFKATHNSYSGGPRGAIAVQLDRGVRFIELDFHDDGFALFGDFRVGHGWPGDEVDHGGGNPASDLLGDWLAAVADWSAANPGHAPITLGLDAKDDLADNPSFADGGLDALDHRLRTAFGAALLPASEIGPVWPTVDALRGRVLVVLSGDLDARRGYLRERAVAPAVAMNGAGRVVLVHADEDGRLWFRTGDLRPDGRVDWRRRGRFGEGGTPAVALSDAGWIVALAEADGTVHARLGRLREDGDVEWWPARALGPGWLPTARFEDLRGDVVHVVQRRPHADLHDVWRGRIDPRSGAIEWTAGEPTTAPLYAVDEIHVAGRSIRVLTAADAAGDPMTLQSVIDRGPRARVRPPQLAFVEFQRGDPADLGPDRRRFHGGDARYGDWAARAREAGHVVRRWRFAAHSPIAGPRANFPAADTPFAPWYLADALRTGTFR